MVEGAHRARQAPEAPLAQSLILQRNGETRGLPEALEGLLCAQEVGNRSLETPLVEIGEPDVVDLQRLIRLLAAPRVKHSESRQQRSCAAQPILGIARRR